MPRIYENGLSTLTLPQLTYFFIPAVKTSWSDEKSLEYHEFVYLAFLSQILFSNPKYELPMAEKFKPSRFTMQPT